MSENLLVSLFEGYEGTGPDVDWSLVPVSTQDAVCCRAAHMGRPTRHALLACPGITNSMRWNLYTEREWLEARSRS